MSPDGMVLGEAARILGLWVLYLVGLGAADFIARRRQLGPESARKLVHVTAGLLAVPLPWMLRTDASMVVLAVGGLVGLLISRRWGLLPSVHGVARSSVGDLLFPVGILLLFVVGHDDPPLYLIGLSCLVVSDALAALVGRRYGRASYAVGRHRKSLEGSVTFFVISFVAAHLILLLGTDVSRLTSVLVATQLAVLATAFEAISTEGNDNLLVPLVACLIADRLIDLPAGILGRDLLVQCGLGLLVAVATARWRFAGAAGAVTLSLFLYGAYALGGVVWMAAPLVGFGAYVLLRSLHWNHDVPEEGHHQVVAVFHVVAAGGLICLVAGTVGGLGTTSTTPIASLLPPYLGATAGSLALLIYTLWRPWDAPPEVLDPGIWPGILAGLVFVPLSVFAAGFVATAVLWTMATPVLALVVYRRVRRGPRWPRAVPWNSRLQTLSVFVALSFVAPIHLSLFAG